jgi:hypothetical protein
LFSFYGNSVNVRELIELSNSRIGPWSFHDFVRTQQNNNTQKYAKVSEANAVQQRFFREKDKLDPKVFWRVETFQAYHSMPVPMECGHSTGAMSRLEGFRG